MNIEFGNFSMVLPDAVVFLLIFLLFSVLTSRLKKKKKEPEVVFEYLNKKKWKELVANKVAMTKEELGRSAAKEVAKSLEEPEKKGRAYVVKFDGGITADETKALREEITSILDVAEAGDEVILKLNSPGGTVNGYGLAAAQLQRIRDKNLILTVLVDRVAASGGYMMACVGNSIIASPFAYVGSVGVVSEFPNFNGILKKAGVDWKSYTAGESKRTVGMFSETTKEKEKKYQKKLEDIHVLFKKHISAYRPRVKVEKIATGEAWTASEALDLGLVDKIQTSDDYINDKLKSTHVYTVELVEPKKAAGILSALLADSASAVTDKILDRIEGRIAKKSLEEKF
jgi:serine protease SohB